MNGPLDGIRVLDFGRLLAAPYASMVLADLGADVIKVDEPPRGDLTRWMMSPAAPGGEDSAYFASINRGKRSIVIDLKRERGRELVRELAAECDVLLDNYRPAVRERLGLDDATLREANPELVICSISAFGQDGPYRDRVGVDLNIQALSGAMYLTGEGGDSPPARLGVPMADLTGGLFAVIGILAGLVRRGKSGGGSAVDISLLDSLVAMLTYVAANYSVTGNEPTPVGSAHHTVVPYQAFRTVDSWIVVACLSENFWPPFCRALGREELIEDPRYAINQQRVANREELVALIGAELAAGTKAEWLARFEAEGFPAAPVSRVSEVLADPQIRHRKMVRTLPVPGGGELEVVGNPVKLAEFEEDVECAPYPRLGEHSGEVLAEVLGFDPEQVERLRAEGVIAAATTKEEKDG
jgi:formyl-CoA transferase/CoA:oxalate CoA-transferase